ncbi:hypothetical protein EV363DRAFT_1195080, partial [Boletus edulis]
KNNRRRARARASSLPFTVVIMPSRHISQAAKEQIIVMSAHMRATKIAEVTGISERAVRRTINCTVEANSVSRAVQATSDP